VPEPQTQENTRPTYIWRGFVRHVRLKPRSVVPSRTVSNNVVDRAFFSLLPWDRDDYPGRGKGALELLGWRVSARAVSYWRAGRRRMPSWARELLADRLEERARTCLEAAQALRDEGKAMPARRATGFAVPGPDGLDARPKSGRRPAKGDREL
jgi:hypothetical protein